jgi:hypothetical protein
LNRLQGTKINRSKTATLQLLVDGIVGAEEWG